MVPDGKDTPGAVGRDAQEPEHVNVTWYMVWDWAAAGNAASGQKTTSAMCNNATMNAQRREQIFRRTLAIVNPPRIAATASFVDPNLGPTQEMFGRYFELPSECIAFSL
jgi:hypothetical protein